MIYTFEDWWRHKRTDLRRELDDHGLAVQDVAQMAWNAAIEECREVAMNMPLDNDGHHSYRWTDTAKAMSWDIAHAIRKRFSFAAGDGQEEG